MGLESGSGAEWEREFSSEIDKRIAKGERVDVDGYARRFPDRAEKVRSLIELRQSLFDEGLLEVDGGDQAAPPADPAKPARDGRIAEVERRFQDAANRGEPPDVQGAIAEFPDLDAQIRDVARFHSFLSDVLTPGDISSSSPPIQELKLSHFRLVAVDARHPLGEWVVGVDTQSSLPAQLLLIRARVSPGRATRLLAAAEEVRRIKHDRIVPLIEVGEAGDLRYAAYDFRSEVNLERIIRRLRRGGGNRTLAEVLEPPSESGHAWLDADVELPLSIPDDAAASRLLADRSHVRGVLRICLGLAEAFDVAHTHGLLLLDTRPSSVVVDRRGSVRLRGLGMVGEARMVWSRLGTEGFFVAPEVRRAADPADWRADVYGLGVLTYAALTLSEPPDFAAVPDRMSLLARSLPHVPNGLCALLAECLDPSLATRLPSAEQFATRLRSLLGEAPERAKLPEETTDVTTGAPSRLLFGVLWIALAAAAVLGVWCFVH